MQIVTVVGMVVVVVVVVVIVERWWWRWWWSGSTVRGSTLTLTAGEWLVRNNSTACTTVIGPVTPLVDVGRQCTHAARHTARRVVTIPKRKCGFCWR